VKKYKKNIETAKVETTTKKVIANTLAIGRLHLWTFQVRCFSQLHACAKGAEALGS
jgi:hypothetical protein